jgi:hypothetical protein
MHRALHVYTCFKRSATLYVNSKYLLLSALTVFCTHLNALLCILLCIQSYNTTLILLQQAALEADLVEKIAAREAVAAAAAAANAKARRTTASSTAAATAATSSTAKATSDDSAQGLRIGWASNPTPEITSNISGPVLPGTSSALGIGKYIGAASGSITLPKLEASLLKANSSSSSSSGNASGKASAVDNSASESLAASLAAGASAASEKAKAKIKSGSSFGNFSSW